MGDQRTQLNCNKIMHTMGLREVWDTLLDNLCVLIVFKLITIPPKNKLTSVFWVLFDRYPYKHRSQSFGLIVFTRMRMKASKSHQIKFVIFMNNA